MEPLPKLDPMTEMALRSLHDIAMPPPVSWMPQTWGWGLLAAVLMVAILALLLRAYLRYRRNAYRREALRELGRIEASMRDPAKRDDAFHALPELLKRTALAAWPRSSVAALTGGNWARFLGTSDNSEEALAHLLDDLEYRRDATLSAISPGIADHAIAGAPLDRDPSCTSLTSLGCCCCCPCRSSFGGCCRPSAKPRHPSASPFSPRWRRRRE